MQYSATRDRAANVASVRFPSASPRRLGASLTGAVFLSLTGGYLDAFTWIAHDGAFMTATFASGALLGPILLLSAALLLCRRI